jgi:predicted DNA-binding transcriptional regulator AlpA
MEVDMSTNEPYSPSETEGHVGPKLLARRDLQALGICVSNPTLLAWEAAGLFPKRLMISPAKVAWLQQEILAWIENKAKERTNAPTA